MNRRRQDSIWSTIQFIRNFVPIRRDNIDWVTVRYDSRIIMYAHLKERADQLIRVYAKIINPGEAAYISDLEESHFVDDLLQEERVVFSTYLTYKLVRFVEYFHDTKIIRAHFVWKVDAQGHGYLDDVTKLKYENQVAF